MTGKRLWWAACAAVAAPLVSQMPAEAATLGVAEVQYLGYLGASDMRVRLNGTLYRGGAGAFKWDLVDVQSSDETLILVNEDNSFLTFCIEVMEHVNTNGNSTYQVVDAEDAPQQNGGLGAMDAERAELLGKWFTSHYKGNTWDLWGSDADERKKNATAFQLGVWEIVYENLLNPFSVTDAQSTFWAESVNVTGAIALANQWLAGSDWLNATPAHLAALSSKYQNEQGEWVGPALQDQVFVTTPSPSAAAAGIGLCGLLGAGVLFRRPNADTAARS